MAQQQVALVTGGNRGIGYEVVQLLASRGYHVLLAGRNFQKGETAVHHLQASHQDVSFIQIDVSNRKSIEEAALTVQEQYGRLDVLVNNAGIMLDKQDSLLTMESSVLEDTMTTNFFGVYHMIRSFVPVMQQQDYGRVVNVSSEYGAMHQMASSGVSAYKLSKFSLNGLTRLLAAEVEGDIKINAVDPGWVHTDMGGSTAPTSPQEAAEAILTLVTVGSNGPNGGFFRHGQAMDW